ncbi:MAG: phospho-N-acetylmuramoyl-pentapeptide-transferase, partial [Actinomycetota bacterium]
MLNIGIAAASALLIAILGTPFAVRRLRQLKWGQLIREEGPRAHYEKAGTPTMGGLVILFAAVAGYAIGHIGRDGLIEFK